MNKTTKQKISKEIEGSNITIDQLNLTSIGHSNPTTAEYTFSSADGKFSKISHALSYKTSLNKCKSIEIIQNTYSHSGSKLEINNKRKFGKFTSMWKLHNTPPNNQLVKEEIIREIRKHFE